MFDSPPSTSPDPSLPSHPNAAIGEVVRLALLRRKRSAILLALTGQLLADTREMLARDPAAPARAGPGARRRLPQDPVAPPQPGRRGRRR